MAKKRSSKPSDPIERELVAIKRLLVVLLYKLGSKQNEIASALDMDQGDISRMVSSRKIKSIINNQK